MQPNDSIDWDLGKAPKQSITEVLQDPRAPTLELPDISTIDLSTSSLSLTPVTPANLPPPLNINHFESYLRRYAPLHASYNRNVHNNHKSVATTTINGTTSADSFPRHKSKYEQDDYISEEKENEIPKAFYEPSFDIASQVRLPEISKSSSSSSSSYSGNDSANNNQVSTDSSSLLAHHPDIQSLRTQLSSYKRVLESQLTSALSASKPALETALEDMRDLRSRIETTAESLRHTRSTAVALPNILTPPLSRARTLSIAKRNVSLLRHALGRVADVMEAPADVTDLLGAGAYNAAIERVSAARSVLAQPDLDGVIALRSVRKQLAQAVEQIDAALRQQFRVALIEQDRTALVAVVRLVAQTGRLSLLRRVFVKEVCDGLQDDLNSVNDIAQAVKIVDVAVKRAVLLVRIIYDEIEHMKAEKNMKNGSTDGQQQQDDNEKFKKASISTSTIITQSNNLTPNGPPNDVLSNLSADDDLKTIHTEFEDLIARFVDKHLGSFDIIVRKDAPEDENPTSHAANSNNLSNPNKNNTGKAGNGTATDASSSSVTGGSSKSKDNHMSFFKSSKTSSSFIILLRDNALTERTCFDELKAALRFSEELHALDQLSITLESSFFPTSKTKTSINKSRGSPLRAKLSEKLMRFVTSFHHAHVDAISEAVRSDKWQEVEAPSGAVKILAAIITAPRKNEKESLPPQQQPRNGAAFVINGEYFRSVACGSRFVRSAACYSLIVEQSSSRTLAIEIARRGAELSRTFNSLVCKAILGVSALQWSGLRSITARHLSLASRTISLAKYITQEIHQVFKRILESSSTISVVLPLMKSCEQDLEQHHNQLLGKIIEVMLDRLKTHEASLRSLPWDKKLEMKRFTVPSPYVATLVKETSVLHRILWQVLPPSETQSIFSTVWIKYATTLEDAYGSLDGGQDWIRDRVADDVACVYNSFKRLDISNATPQVFKPIVRLYDRFAREVVEERAENNKKLTSATNTTTTSTATASITPSSNTSRSVATTPFASSNANRNVSPNSPVFNNSNKNQGEAIPNNEKVSTNEEAPPSTKTSDENPKQKPKQPEVDGNDKIKTVTTTKSETTPTPTDDNNSLNENDKKEPEKPTREQDEANEATDRLMMDDDDAPNKDKQKEKDSEENQKETDQNQAPEDTEKNTPEKGEE